MQDQYFIGIDGGGTKSRCVIGDADGHIIAHKVSTSGNINAVSLTQLHDMLQDMIEAILALSKISVHTIQKIFICLAGAERSAEKEKIQQSFLGSVLYEKIVIHSDTHAALAAGTWGVPGTLLIAGTGSIVYGWTDKQTFRVGGWGYLLGDEGSGFHLGKLAIQSILASHDAKKPMRTFQKSILNHFHVEHPPNMISEIYSLPTPVPIIASISRYVIAAFENGDKMATELVQQIYGELCRLIDLAKYQMDLNRPLVLHGGLFTNASFYEAFRTKLKQQFPSLLITRPEVPGEVGAYILALHAKQIEIGEPMKNMIKNSWNDLKGGVL